VIHRFCCSRITVASQSHRSHNCEECFKWVIGVFCCVVVVVLYPVRAGAGAGNSLAETVEPNQPIKMPFVGRTLVDLRNHELDAGPEPSLEGPVSTGVLLVEEHYKPRISGVVPCQNG